MLKSLVRAAFCGFCAASLALVPQIASAGTLTRDGFAFPAGNVKVVVFRPEVEVGSLGVGGVESPNADWTATARKNLQSAFETAGEARQAELNFLGDPEGESAQLLTDYRGLFKVVSTEILNHGVFFDRLPTKKLPPKEVGGKVRYNLDWTLGAEAAKLKAVTGADYALFIYTHDAYGSAGRKAAQLFLAMAGVGIQAGVHMGYAGLVDLNSGQFVWFNADIQMGGDPRETDGATKRVQELLRGFPQRGAPPAVTPDTKN